MNSFPIEKYSGLQVYYSDNGISKGLAESIQKNVKENLQESNQRVSKPSNGNIYLLDRAGGTSILIECGFLSNTEECEKLTDPIYQKKLALSLYDGIYEYITEVDS